METKTLVYLIAAVLWFIFKSREERKKSQATKNDLPKSIETQETYRPQATKNPVKPVIIKPTIKVPVPVQRPINDRMFKQKEEKELLPDYLKRKKSEIPMPFIQSEISNFIYMDENEFKSVGNLIGEEIKNGKIDWRQAMVINELLRPAYLSQNINR